MWMCRATHNLMFEVRSFFWLPWSGGRHFPPPNTCRWTYCSLLGCAKVRELSFLLMRNPWRSPATDAYWRAESTPGPPPAHFSRSIDALQCPSDSHPKTYLLTAHARVHEQFLSAREGIRRTSMCVEISKYRRFILLHPFQRPTCDNRTKTYLRDPKRPGKRSRIRYL